ncbi:hypothetical protein NDN08_001727 [Rhodosorus marinus]|uniref:C3H1-type domain-containing protein n=1 Tax=Rhodosorus marinus TaxID=101924 RepID=A0AAV8UUF8_9RHOD|nr:hypothetical protein NDN08_001727 [Rhodosorus marinus]
MALILDEEELLRAGTVYVVDELPEIALKARLKSSTAKVPSDPEVANLAETIQTLRINPDLCREWLSGRPCGCVQKHGTQVPVSADEWKRCEQLVSKTCESRRWRLKIKNGKKFIETNNNESDQMHHLRELGRTIATELPRSMCQNFRKGIQCKRPVCFSLHGVVKPFSASERNSEIILAESARYGSLRSSEVVQCSVDGVHSYAVYGRSYNQVEDVVSFIEDRRSCSRWIDGKSCSKCPYLHGSWLFLGERLAVFRKLEEGIASRLASIDPRTRILEDDCTNALFVTQCSVHSLRFLDDLLPMLDCPKAGLEDWIRGRRGWRYSKDFNTKKAEERLEGICKRLTNAMKGAEFDRTVVRRLFLEEIDDRLGRNPQRLPMASANYQTKVLSVRKFLEHITWFCDAVLNLKYHPELREVLEICSGKTADKPVIARILRSLKGDYGLRIASSIKVVLQPDKSSKSLLRSSRAGPDVPCQWAAHTSTNPYRFTLITNETQLELAQGLSQVADFIIQLRDILCTSGV